MQESSDCPPPAPLGRPHTDSASNYKSSDAVPEVAIKGHTGHQYLINEDQKGLLPLTRRKCAVTARRARRGNRRNAQVYTRPTHPATLLHPAMTARVLKKVLLKCRTLHLWTWYKEVTFAATENSNCCSFLAGCPIRERKGGGGEKMMLLKQEPGAEKHGKDIVF